MIVIEFDLTMRVFFSVSDKSEKPRYAVFAVCGPNEGNE